MSLNDPSKYKSLRNEDREHSPAGNLSEREKEKKKTFCCLWSFVLFALVTYVVH